MVRKAFSENPREIRKSDGDPMALKQGRDGDVAVDDISEDFFAGVLGEDGFPEMPTVFVGDENRFYTYDPSEGHYRAQTEASLLFRLSKMLRECCENYDGGVDVTKLAYRFSKTASLAGVIKRAKGVLEVPGMFFDANLVDFLPCTNGMLRLSDFKLLPFSPAFRRRNKLGIAYDPEATCPRFLDQLMRPALDEEDLELLQRWCGQALIGVNLAQVILFLIGTPGGGKGTFIRILNRIIGPENMATFRSALLMNRFEISGFVGKTLLYGADVAPDFLNCSAAAVLKSLTGLRNIRQQTRRIFPPTACESDGSRSLMENP
ncbi:MAG: hypothetical protein FJY98_03760 [Candidatus Liptonbacteria bacterium]|nr:hypothetical protein [Candidatus Liptonbacteria bacterium]